MPCQRPAPAQVGDTPGLDLKPNSVASAESAVFDRDPIATRLLHHGQHGLQLLVQLERAPMPKTDGAEASKRSRPEQDVGEHPSPIAKRRKGLSTGDSDIDVRWSVARTCSDQINRFIKQIEDVDGWSDSSQTILAVLNDVMRNVQRFGLADPDNEEHCALRDEIGREVAQIEHLVHDYGSSLRHQQQGDDLPEQDVFL